MPGYTSVLVSSHVDGPTLSNSTTETSLLPTHAKYYLGGSFFYVNGQQIRVRAAGRISTAASSPGNLVFSLKFGSTAVLSTQSIPLATSQTNISWQLDILLTCRGLAASATALPALFPDGRCYSAAFTTAFNLVPASAAAIGNTFDHTAAQLVDFTATHSAQSASNSLTCHTYQLMSES